MDNLTVEERNGAVILTLEDHYAILTPDQAEQIGEMMARYSYQARTGKTPDSKSVIAERIKGKMVMRCIHVMKSLTDKKKSPEFIANEMVNLILSEAL